jgi:hypothetical protein
VPITILHIKECGVLFGYRKNDILSFVKKWLELEVIMLNKISQTHNDKCHISYMKNLGEKRHEVGGDFLGR